MKKHFTFFIFLFLSLSGFAQREKYTRNFGFVTQYEMAMKEYENDPEADAVVLYSQGEYSFYADRKRGFLLQMKKQVKIKILKQSGIKYANFEIPFYIGNEGWEDVQSIEGTTYNSDQGFTQTKLVSKNIFEEKINDNVRVKKIALSDVRPGSVIEFSYTIVTPYFFNMRAWYFQEKIPVLFSNLKYKAIPYYEYIYILKGTDKFDISTSSTSTGQLHFGNLSYFEKIYDFGMENLPAFKDEEYIASIDDFIINLNFQLSKIQFPHGGKKDIMTTWKDMCTEFIAHEDFGKYIKKVEKQAPELLSELDLNNLPLDKQVEAITNFVKSKYNWNGQTGKLANSSLKDFLKQRSGNVGNINLLLIGLLKSKGIEADPVILSTRDNGYVNINYPFQHFFNYVIAKVTLGDRTILIDATEPLLSYSSLPVKLLNVNGLVVKPKAEEWITIQQRTSSSLQKNLKLTIVPDENKVRAEAIYIAAGHDAYRLRSTYQGKAENLTKYLKDKEKVDAPTVDVVNADKLERPFILSFKFENSIDNNSGKLFVNPFCYLSLKENPFKQASRSLPVDLVFLQGETYQSLITIPEGYKVDYIPEKKEIDDDLLTFSYSTSHNDDQLIIEARYQFKKHFFPKEEYGQLKRDFDDMVKSLSDMIVLVKKEE